MLVVIFCQKSGIHNNGIWKEKLLKIAIEFKQNINLTTTTAVQQEQQQQLQYYL